MARTVKVGLDVDEQPYVRGVGRAEKATEKLDDALDGVKGSARDTAAGMGKAKDQIGDTGDAARKAGRDLGGLARDADRLDRQIDDTTRGIRDLARAIAAASDEADRAKLSEKLKVEQGKQRGLLGLRKLVDFDDNDAKREGVRWGAKIAEGIGTGLSTAGGPITRALGNVFGTLPPQAQLALGAGVVAAVGSVAPLVGGVISGAVVGAAGVGGVIGGLAIAARHPAVQAAAKATGETFATTMERSGVSFVPATLAALGKVRAGILDLADDFERIFAKSSRFVEPLTNAVLGFVRNALPGLEAAIDRGSPIINELASWGPKLGTLVSDTFAKFAAHADEGARALAAFFTIFRAGVDFVVDGIVVLTASFGVMEKLSAALRGDIVKLMELAAAEEIAKQEGGSFAETLKELLGGLDGVGTSASVAAQEIESLAEMVDRLTGENLDARAANRNLESAIDDAAAAVKENGRTLDESTPKGRANAEALDAIARTAKQSAAAILAQTGSQELASAATTKGRIAFLKTAEAMGVEKGEALALANQLFGIPDDVTTNAHFNPANKAVSNWKATLSGIPREIFTSARLRAIVNIETRREQATQATGRRWGGITEHAQSGLLREAALFTPRSPARYAFAEPATGGEAFVPRFGDRERSLSILDQAAGWYGKTLASRAPTYMGQMGAGGMRVVNVTYNIPVTVAAGANPAEGGRQVVEQIRAYEHRNGPGWRS